LGRVCWWKNKRKLYGVGQLTRNYKSGNDSLKHQASTFFCISEDIFQLTQRLSINEKASEAIDL